MKKISVLLVGAVGYVLGSRAGRQRYEQIKRQATKVWNSPTVQKGMDEAQTQAKAAASDVSHKVAEAAGEVKDKISDKVSSGHEGEGQPAASPGDTRGTA